MRSTLLIGSFITVGLLLGLAAPARAQDTQPAGQTMEMKVGPDGKVEFAPATKPTTQPAKISPEAKAIIEQMRDAYAKLESLELKGAVRGEFDAAGDQKKDQTEFSSTFRAPDKFQFQMQTLQVGNTGKKVYIFDTHRKVYTQVDSPKDRPADGALGGDVGEMLALAGPSANPSLLLAIAKDASAALTTNVLEVSREADVDVDGKPFNAIKLTTIEPKVVVTMLVDPQTHLLRRATADISEMLRKAGVENVKMAQVTVDYTTSTPGAAIKDEQFAWAPPQGAREMAAAAAEEGGDGEGGGSALAGKPAPDFQLDALDGAKVKLADLKGKVVLLDFWATWCGPCRAAMPHIQKLAEDQDLAQQGLKVYGVNLKESKAKVQKFVDAQKFTIPMLLDSDGAVAGKYGVQAIPMTVVIGRDGKVAKVFVGLSGPEALHEAIATALKAPAQ